MKIDKENIINSIWNSFITEWNPSEELYQETGKELEKGVYQGFGETLMQVKHTGDFETLKALHDNVYIFSAAKTFQQTLDIRRVIFDENGYKRAFNDFKKDASKIFDIYNDVWLKTEYDTAITQAYATSQWQEIEKEKNILPYLTYQTSKDEATCPICAPFDGMTRHVNDPFWNYATPPLHYKCRCLLIQMPDDTKMTNKIELPKESIVPEMFRFNPGKDKYIFPATGEYAHPYFKVAEKYKIFKQNNFGFEIPKE